MSEGLGLIGGGGHSDEVESYSKRKIDFWAADYEFLNQKITVDISNPGDKIDSSVHIAVGAPFVRRELEEKWPGMEYETIISEHAYVDESAEIGPGSLVAPHAVITTDVKLGRHTIINVGASVQHGTTIGEFSTIGPGVHIGGNVMIGNGVFIGIGANISNAITIADGVVIGAGSTLLQNASEQNGVYVGTPARLIRKNEDWLHEI